MGKAMVATIVAMMMMQGSVVVDHPGAVYMSGDHPTPGAIDGRVQVVQMGEYPPARGITVPILIHNGTDHPVYRVELKIEAYGPDGQLVQVMNETYGVIPGMIDPGGIGVTSMQPDQAMVPDGSRFEFMVSYDDQELSNPFAGPLDIVSIDTTTGIGVIQNNTDHPIADARLHGVCVGDGGDLLAFVMATTATGGIDPVIQPGGSSSFQITLPDACPGIIIAGYGKYEN